VKMSEHTDKSRRKFLAGSAVTALAGSASVGFLALDAESAPRGEPVSDSVRWGMLVDTDKCATGCTDCVDACDRENGLNLLEAPEGADAENWSRQRPHWMRQVKVRDNLTSTVTTLPMMCQHCEKPPCVDVCPTGASFRRADGVVLVDRHSCIGCRYCMMACPYKARSFIHESISAQLTRTPRGKGCVESCNLCVHRLDNGQTTTACQDACQHQAIVFGDLKDPNSAVAQAMRANPSVQIRADLKLNTGVRYSKV